MIRFYIIISIVGILTWSQGAFALRETKPLALDKRIHILVYNPDDVFKYTGHYGLQSSILFAPGEAIGTISMGDSLAWQIVPEGNRLFLKPMEENATTNMTVITDRRIYQFELHAKEPDAEKGLNDDQVVFEVRFVYPSSPNVKGGIRQVESTNNDIDFSQPGKYNFNYTIAGQELIAPIKVFDDSEFTYFEFKKTNTEIPSFFLVDSQGKDSLINYRMHGNYVVVERVAPRFTLRNGSDIICIFNENMPYRKFIQKRPWYLFWKFW